MNKIIQCAVLLGVLLNGTRASETQYYPGNGSVGHSVPPPEIRLAIRNKEKWKVTTLEWIITPQFSSPPPEGARIVTYEDASDWSAWNDFFPPQFWVAFYRTDNSEWGPGFYQLDAEYKVVASPVFAGTKITWTESYNPEGSSGGATETVRSWTVNGNQSPSYALSTSTDGAYAIGPFTLKFPVKLTVDANRDGTVDNAEVSDATTEELTFGFWINDDIDRSDSTYCITSGSETEQDDKYSADTNQQDWRNNIISCERDLEDFARIQLYTAGFNEAFKNGDLYLGLKWKNTTGTPAIKLYRATDTDGSDAYMTSPTAAAHQSLEAAIIDARYPDYSGGNFQSDHTLIEGSEVFILPPLQFISLSETSPRTNFIFEACKTGKGQLNIVILKKEGTNYTEIGEGPGVWMQIEDIKNVYERYTVGDDSSAEPSAVASLMGYSYPAPVNDEEKDYVLYVHGYNMPVWEKERWAETVYKRLWHLGYKGRVGIYEWPCTVPECVPDSTDIFDQSEFRAWQSGAGLRGVLANLKAAGYRVRVIAHSQGNVVMSEALRQAGSGSNLVHTYAACQGALAAHCFNPSSTLNMDFPWIRDDGTPNIYAQYQEPGMSSPKSYLSADFVAGAAGSFVNFYNQRDYALSPSGGAFGSGSWQLDNQLKPNQGYGYNSVDGFFKSVAGGGLAGLHTPGDRYEIFCFGAEARSFAVGSASGVGGVFGSEVDLDGSSYNFGPEHIGHSAEFRSFAADRRAFWEELLSAFDIDTGRP